MGHSHTDRNPNRGPHLTVSLRAPHGIDRPDRCTGRLVYHHRRPLPRYIDRPLQDLLSLPLALAGGGVEAAAFAQALPEPVPLLGAHVVPAFGHAIGHSIGDATPDR